MTVLDAETQLGGLRKAAEFFNVDVPAFVMPDERHVIAGSMRIHMLDWGSAGRPPILFVHGTGLTAHTWDLSILQIRGDYHCRAMDLRGHGDSEWSPAMDYGVHHHASDIEGVADALGLDRFVLVGMSLGGLASTMFATRSAARLAGLVIVDAAPGIGSGPRHGREGVSRINTFIQRQDEHDDVEGFVQEALAFNPRRDPNLLRVSLRHNLRRLADGKWTWKYDRRHHARPAVMAGMAGAMQELRDGLGKITCPTIVVRGAQSDVLVEEDADAFVKALPNARRTTVEGAGHNVQGDNPRAFIEAIRTFLQDAVSA